MAKASTEDRNFPIPSFRDPRTVVHIFDLEVSKGSLDYKLLTKLSNEQFYENVPKSKKLKDWCLTIKWDLKLFQIVPFLQKFQLESIQLIMILLSLQFMQSIVMLRKQVKIVKNKLKLLKANLKG